MRNLIANQNSNKNRVILCVISRKFSKRDRILRDVISNATPKKKSEHSQVCLSQVSREGTFSQICLLREDEGQSDELSRCSRKNMSHSRHLANIFHALTLVK